MISDKSPSPEIVRHLQELMSSKRGNFFVEISTSMAIEACRPFFDGQYYKNTYPDIQGSDEDALRHYVESGWSEGRNPSSDFNSVIYIAVNAKTQRFLNPLVDFVSRWPDVSKAFPTTPDAILTLNINTIVPFFDKKFYSEKTKTSFFSIESAVKHYLATPIALKRDPSPTFSVDDYLNRNQPVARSNVDPFFCHIVYNEILPRYRRRQFVEGYPVDDVTSEKYIKTVKLNGTEIFSLLSRHLDGRYYLKTNEDIAREDADPVIHYALFGWEEDRDPTAWFWTRYYLSQNPDVAKSGINPFLHFILKGEAEGRLPNPCGRGPWMAIDTVSMAQWEQAERRKNVANARVDVIIPTYVSNATARAETLLSIYKAITAENLTKFEVVVVNDCSPDSEYTDTIRKLSNIGVITYIENGKNLGFVGSVNAGLALHLDRDVILLNSDAFVTGNWIDRMFAHADADPMICTITPFSNNATVCSYPVCNRDNNLPLEISPAELDRFASICNKGRANELPSGVGFCYYMRREAIEKLGVLDFETFGRGYGEENDFSMRALRAGYKNILAHDIFVLHTGEVSFAEIATSRRDNAQAVLDRMHPDYHNRVARYVWADPAKIGRARLDAYRFAKAAGERPVVLVAHNWGGGIEAHLTSMRSAFKRSNIPYVIFRLDRSEPGVIRLESETYLHCPNLDRLRVDADSALISEIIEWLNPRLFHIHTVAGVPLSKGKQVLDLAVRSGVKIVYTWHDANPFCHRNHLVMADGNYCFDPGLKGCEACFESDFRKDDDIRPRERAEIYDRFLRHCSAIIAPSHSAAERARKMLGNIDTIKVIPHEDLVIGTPIAPAVRVKKENSARLKVAVIGSIGAHKGADVLYAMAKDAEYRQLPIEFVLIGENERENIAEFRNVTSTGRYNGDAEGLEVVRKVAPDLCLFASIWPETFCYALSVALKLGIPQAVFDLGAQAERVRTAGFGAVLDVRLMSDPAAVNDALLGLDLDALWRASSPAEPVEYPDIWRDYYAKALQAG